MSTTESFVEMFGSKDLDTVTHVSPLTVQTALLLFQVLSAQHGNHTNWMELGYDTNWQSVYLQVQLYGLRAHFNPLYTTICLISYVFTSIIAKWWTNYCCLWLSWCKYDYRSENFHISKIFTLVLEHVTKRSVEDSINLNAWARLFAIAMITQLYVLLYWTHTHWHIYRPRAIVHYFIFRFVPYKDSQVNILRVPFT